MGNGGWIMGEDIAVSIIYILVIRYAYVLRIAVAPQNSRGLVPIVRKNPVMSYPHSGSPSTTLRQARGKRERSSAASHRQPRRSIAEANVPTNQPRKSQQQRRYRYGYAFSHLLGNMQCSSLRYVEYKYGVE